ncbi:MAG: helix-turn-helix transcriptional regulator [Verrucomicrobiota bacterium]
MNCPVDCDRRSLRQAGKRVNHISHMWESYRRTLRPWQRPCKSGLADSCASGAESLTLPAYARKLGISSSSLHRMEMGEQNVTLKTLEQLLKRLNCRIVDVFDDLEMRSKAD